MQKVLLKLCHFNHFVKTEKRFLLRSLEIICCFPDDGILRIPEAVLLFC